MNGSLNDWLTWFVKKMWIYSVKKHRVDFLELFSFAKLKQYSNVTKTYIKFVNHFNVLFLHS